MKTQVLEQIGETDLNRAAQIDAALAANDRIKYYFTLLQAGVTHADHLDQPVDPLQRERAASGIEDRTFDDLVINSRRENEGYRLPGCGSVLERMVQDLRVMAAPVLVENASGARAGFAERLERLLAGVPSVSEDLIDRSAI